MGKRYIQGRKLFWASLALLLVLVVLPASIGLAEWWNESVAGTDVIAFEMNNDTAIPGYITVGLSAPVGMEIYDTAGEHAAAQGVFWNANGSWNEFLVDTGASTADNTTQRNNILFHMNISAQEILNKNINKIVIKLRGLEKNRSFDLYIKQGNTNFLNSASYSYSNAEGGNSLIGTYTTDNNGTINITYKLQPAIVAAIAQKTNDTVLTIVVHTHDPANEVVMEGDTIDFQIYMIAPHGRMVVSGYDFMTWVIGGFTGLGIVVLLVTSPMWNPTTHTGMIEKMINRAKYRHSHSGTRRRSSSHRTHRTHRSSNRYRRTTHHRRRR